MRVLREGRIAREGLVVAEEGRMVVQITRAQDRAQRRVRHGLVALGELENDRLGAHAGQRALHDVRRVRDGVAGLCRPLDVVDDQLDGRGRRVRVDDGRQVAKRDVLLELRHDGAGCRIECGWTVGEARHARGQGDADEKAERRAQTRDFDDGPARHVGNARPYRRLDC